MSNNEIVQLKSYDENTGQEIGNVLPITNSEAVKTEDNKTLKQKLTEINKQIEQTNASLDNVIQYFDGKINLEDYSHLVTDNDWTGALQQAVNECLNQKKYLEVTGKYKITNTIYINNEGTANAFYFGQRTLGIIGDGAFKSHIYMDDSITDGRPMFTGTEFTSQPNNLARIQVYFRNCSFSRGLKYFRSANDSGCSLFENCRLTASIIDNCGIFALDYIIKNGAFGDSYFTNNVTYDIRTSHIQGIIGDSRISHNMLTGSSQKRSIVFDCENINMSYFTDNWIQWADQIIKCPYFSSSHINSNTFDLCRNPLNLSVMNGSIIGNTFHKCSYYELSKANNYSMTEDEEFVFAKITKLGKNGGCSLIGNNGKNSEQIAIITIDENSEVMTFGNHLYEDNNHYRGETKIKVINTSNKLPYRTFIQENNNIDIKSLDDERLYNFAGQIININNIKCQCSADKKILDSNGSEFGYQYNLLPTFDNNSWVKDGNLQNINISDNGDKITFSTSDKYYKTVYLDLTSNLAGNYKFFGSKNSDSGGIIELIVTKADGSTEKIDCSNNSRNTPKYFNVPEGSTNLRVRMNTPNVNTHYRFNDFFLAKLNLNNIKSIDFETFKCFDGNYKNVYNTTTKILDLVKI